MDEKAPDSNPASPENYNHFLANLRRLLVADGTVLSGSGEGLIRSDEAGDSTLGITGVGPYIPGKHTLLDLDMVATVANERPLAYQRPGHENPRALQILVEFGERYHGTTGVASLVDLARMTVAMTCLAAEQAQTRLNIMVAMDNDDPKIVNIFNTNAVPHTGYNLKAYDTFTDRPRPDNEVKDGVLVDAVRYSYRRSGMIPKTDFFILVSDFLEPVDTARPLRDEPLSWEPQVRRLRADYGDRLGIIRLKSPAQIDLPDSLAFSDHGREDILDFQTYGEIAAKTREIGQYLDKQIDRALKPTRHVVLSSVDTTPYKTLARFLFGRPHVD